ncbi:MULTISPECIES: preprotein translocase subunit SecE [Anoxynatronum]|uniref:Protein translocase subunit SecE n=2 Tax=Anoxynatronum TaxID=210622 RepID=A0AA45WZZ5_9CLOT|nr:preprotein translocase subunit SecE [Anoxynatronum buryatiense]SMP69846.1 preprotein translocase subunit SecE [Anoxynatronum buryatiense]
MANQTVTAPTKSQSIGKYVRSSRAELKKVHWPTREELKNHTAVVVAVCLMATLALWVLDTVFGFGLNMIIR